MYAHICMKYTPHEIHCRSYPRKFIVVFALFFFEILLNFVRIVSLATRSVTPSHSGVALCKCSTSKMVYTSFEPNVPSDGDIFAQKRIRGGLSGPHRKPPKPQNAWQGGRAGGWGVRWSIFGVLRFLPPPNSFLMTSRKK